jgi:signal transduction histidine kinase
MYLSTRRYQPAECRHTPYLSTTDLHLIRTALLHETGSNYLPSQKGARMVKILKQESTLLLVAQSITMLCKQAIDDPMTDQEILRNTIRVAIARAADDIPLSYIECRLLDQRVPITPLTSNLASKATRAYASQLGKMAIKQNDSQLRANSKLGMDFASFPLAHNSLVTGALTFARARLHHSEFTPEEIDTLFIVAQQIGTMVVLVTERIQRNISAKSQWRELLETAPEGIIIRNRYGQITHWNQAALSFASNQDEVLAAQERDDPSVIPIWETFFLDDTTIPPDSLPGMQAIIMGQSIQNVQIKCRVHLSRANQSEMFVPLLVSAAPIINEKGRVDGSITFFQDISTMSDINARYERALHDVKTPVMAISLLLDMFDQSIRKCENGHISKDELLAHFPERLHKMRQSAEQAINRCQIANRLPTYHDTPISFQSVLESYQQQERFDYIERMSIDVHPSTLQAYGLWQPGDLESVIANIVSNAFKHNPPETRVTITATVETHIGRNQLHLTISDNGRGIPEEDLPNIFQRGWSREARIPNQLNSGKGLAFCRQLVTQTFGGELICDSTLGRGTTFTIWLPIVKK